MRCLDFTRVGWWAKKEVVKDKQLNYKDRRESRSYFYNRQVALLVSGWDGGFKKLNLLDMKLSLLLIISEQS
ncbi:hypothetical protein C7H19_24780 [Aphanothece hegewaldii CCALA 016]|uniref:Uncharacterized protein n=1 Tax=Aphanothece hegewaldii CCALA 016 TaxID=2107694 RepID=A0A2T1LQH4_9CHRO|nr:hypothetical protein C7H19_24780 [Aphanothece hegewaldii CCALA 016]